MQVLKKAKHTGFLAILGFGLYWVFRTFFYLNKQFESLLVDVAHHLSFYLDLLVL